VRGLPRFNDPNLLVGAEHFSDAGVYQLGEHLAIVQTVDFFPPLVDDPFVYGQIAAANSLSDVYAMGGQPKTALNIVGFPDDHLELDVLHEILRGGAERVQAAGAVIVGGHTVRDMEIKYGLAVTGVVDPDRMFTNDRAKPGDMLVLTKPLGTGFVTTAFKRGRCPGDVLATACSNMVQLNAIGCEAALLVGAHAMTDITGFGLAGHANELAQASAVSLVLELHRLPILAGAESLARQGNQTRASATNRAFVQPVMRLDPGLDPVRLEFLFDAQTSGGLLISVPPDRAEELVTWVRGRGATGAAVVGSVTEKQAAALIIRE
jgi:selenide,water dikinase